MTAVLITGTSSGIGRAIALRLARRADLTVYATARREASIRALADAGARLLSLDVTDEDTMREAVAKSRPNTARLAPWSTTPATANTVRSKRCLSRGLGPSLKPTCSGWPG